MNILFFYCSNTNLYPKLPCMRTRKCLVPLHGLAKKEHPARITESQLTQQPLPHHFQETLPQILLSPMNQSLLLLPLPLLPFLPFCHCRIQRRTQTCNTSTTSPRAHHRRRRTAPPLEDWIPNIAGPAHIHAWFGSRGQRWECVTATSRCGLWSR